MTRSTPLLAAVNRLSNLTRSGRLMLVDGAKLGANRAAPPESCSFVLFSLSPALPALTALALPALTALPVVFSARSRLSSRSRSPCCDSFSGVNTADRRVGKARSSGRLDCESICTGLFWGSASDRRPGRPCDWNIYFLFQFTIYYLQFTLFYMVYTDFLKMLWGVQYSQVLNHSRALMLRPDNIPLNTTPLPKGSTFH